MSFLRFLLFIGENIYHNPRSTSYIFPPLALVKIDKLAEEERRRKQEEERIFREDEMRELALKLREKERKKRRFSDEEDEEAAAAAAFGVGESSYPTATALEEPGAVEDKNGSSKKDKPSKKRWLNRGIQINDLQNPSVFIFTIVIFFSGVVLVPAALAAVAAADLVPARPLRGEGATGVEVTRDRHRDGHGDPDQETMTDRKKSKLIERFNSFLSFYCIAPPFFLFGGILGSASRVKFPVSLSKTMLSLRLVELKMLGFSDHTRTGISILTSAAD